MASAKFIIVELCVLAAIVQAAPHGKQGGSGESKEFGELGKHGGPFGPRPCMVPNTTMLTHMGLDSATAQSVVKLWENYRNGTNCSDIQAKEEAIVKPVMEAAKAAKVAALNVNETAVYHQIEAVLNDSSVIDKKEKRTKIDAILDASSDAIKEKLKAIFPFFFEYDVEHGHGDHKGEHGHGDHSGKHGHGNHNGTLSTTPASSG